MKFITLNKLNENLRSFFSGIVKPYIDKELSGGSKSGLNFKDSYTIQAYAFNGNGDTAHFIFLDNDGMPTTRENGISCLKFWECVLTATFNIVEVNGENFPEGFLTYYPEENITISSLLDLVNLKRYN